MTSSPGDSERSGPSHEPGVTLEPSDALARDALKSMLFGGGAASRRIGRYRILGVLGEGGMGVVFHGHDEELSRPVALKVLHDAHAAGPQARARLLREARAMAQLSHPHVVQVYEVGTFEEQTFVAMELVDGRDLERWRAEAKRSWRACVRVYLQAGLGLAAAHAAGLVHRDFKPSNCIIDDTQRVRVLDFGLARQLDLEDSSTMPLARSDGVEEGGSGRLASITRDGAVLGTVAYMPPEQMAGREADARSDQFSFCVALYEAIYGTRPYAGDTLTALMESIERGRVEPPPGAAGAPARLHRILARGLAADPERRWPSMDALLDALRPLVAPRRGRWVAAGMVVLGTGLGAQAMLPRAEPCEGAQARLEGVWDDARRHAAREAVVGTALPYARGTWERVEPWLDEYAQAWVAAHTQACEATAVHREQSERVLGLRMRCIDRRRSALRATVDALAGADATVVEHAVTLVTALPELSRCDDLDWIEQHQQQVPPPEDPAVAQQVDDLRDRLTALEVAMEAGHYARALEGVEPVVEEARGLDYPPLLAEAEYWHGRLLDEAGQYADAERALERAHALALRAGHDEVVLHASQALVGLVGAQLARHAEGLVWAKAALPLAERTGDDAERAVTWNNLGIVHRVRGEYEQAQEHQLRALQAWQRVRGEDDPRVATSWHNLGNVLMAQGRYEEAARHFRPALQIWERSLGEDHPDVALASRSLGNALLRQGAHPEAERHYRRALGIVERSLGEEHARTALYLQSLGTALCMQDECEQARPLYERALRIQVKELGPDHPEVAASSYNLGTLLIGQEAIAPSKPHHQRALRIWEQALGPEHPHLAYPLASLAEVALLQDDPAEARAQAQRAWSIVESSEAVEPELRAYVSFMLARALWSEPADRAQARARARAARDTWAGGAEADRLAEVEAWLREHEVAGGG